MNLRPFALERYLADHEFQTRHHLCASDCESWSIRDLLALEPAGPGLPDGVDSLLGLRLGYTESQGSPGLRREIARIYSTISPEHVLVHSGAEEAIFLFMHALLEPGDEVIVHSPCYQALIEVPRAIGATVIPWMARARDGWAPDVAALEAMITPKTRAIVINFPHNPTGHQMKEADFRRLHELARERGVLVFSDEVYRESEHSDADRLPAACDLGDHAVSLGVMSKTYGLPGLRIGWVASRDSGLLKRMAELKDYTTICNSAPSELLAEVALRHRETLVRRNVGIIRRNLALLDSFFSERSDRFTWTRPRAGPIAFPRFNEGDALSFCQMARERAQVLLLPGTVFGADDGHFRIGFGRENMPEALAALRRLWR